MSTVSPIGSNEEYESYVSSLPPSALSVLYFHAPWAAPCQQTSAILSTLASTYPATSPVGISFVSINAEDLPDVSEAHDITQVPYVVLRRGESTLDGIAGTDAAKLRAAVERHHAGSSSSRSTLPPAQAVTRPAQQPAPAAPHAAPQQQQQTETSSSAGTARNLSAYAPSANDPPTAPAFSSSETSGAAAKEELHKRLDELTHAAPVMLFMKGTPSAPQCGFSRQLVSILREKSVRYGFFNILADDEVRQGLKEYSDWPTFPQLYLGGELVGGLDIVREELEGNPMFFDEYKAGTGGPAAPEAQAQPTAPQREATAA